MSPAASRLAAEHYSSAVRFARHIFPREDDIDGVVIERLCWAASEWIEKELSGEFWPWAMSYLRYKLYDWWRLEYGREMTSAKRRQFKNVPIDAHARESIRGGELLTHLEMIPSDVTDPEEHVTDSLQAEFIVAVLNTGRFSDRERDVMRRRAEGKTLREIGDELGFTESRACQIIAKSKKKLETYME